MSDRQRQQMAEQLAEENAKAAQARKSEAVHSLAEFSTVADRVPESFREGSLHRAADFNAHGFGDAWHHEGDDRSFHVEAAVQRVAQDFDRLIDAVHGDDDSPDESGHADENVQSLVRDLRSAAHLGSRFPSGLVENWAAYQLSRDPDAVEAIKARDENPSAYENWLSRAGYVLNREAVSLETGTRPSMKLPAGVDIADLADMPEAEFQKVVRSVRRGQEAAKKGKKR
jgi:hypothetical protein